MNSLERVRRVVRGEPVDHLPAQPVLMMFAARHAGMRYIDYTRDGRKLAAAQLKLWRDFGVDCLLTCSDPAREVADIAGEDSLDWFDDQGPAINEGRAALRDKTRLVRLRVPDPLGGGRMHDRIKAIEMMRREVRDEVSVVGWVEGPLALASELRGLNAFMVDLVENPVFARDLLDFCAEVAIRYAPAQIAAGADTIGMSDAAACMIGPERYRALVWPAQRRVLESIRRAHPDVLLRLHMCGRTDPLFDAMQALPADIYEIDFPADLKEARRRLGPDRVICGNVSTIGHLLEGTPDRVYAATRECHRICGRCHIVGAGCEVSPRTPPENLRAMFRYARDAKPEAFDV